MPEPLTHERIVRAAIELIERDGLEAVSMRRLATSLGAGAMSLYNHVANKSELLDAVAEYILVEDQPRLDPDADWTEQARALLGDFRDRLRRHPRCITLVVGRFPRTGAGLRHREAAHRVALAAGLGEADADLFVQTFVNFALGCLVHEASLVEAGSFESGVAETDPQAEYEFGLTLLLNAVAALVRV